jgi:hypothetical protein
MSSKMAKNQESILYQALLDEIYVLKAENQALKANNHTLKT